MCLDIHRHLGLSEILMFSSRRSQVQHPRSDLPSLDLARLVRVLSQQLCQQWGQKSVPFQTPLSLHFNHQRSDFPALHVFQKRPYFKSGTLRRAGVRDEIILPGKVMKLLGVLWCSRRFVWVIYESFCWWTKSGDHQLRKRELKSHYL